MNKKITTLLIILISTTVLSQNFTRQDTLRGSITSERAWWNLTHYDLKVEVQPDKKFISGTNTISYTVLDAHDRMQIDLQPPMKMEKVVQNGKEISFETDGNAHFLILENQNNESYSKLID